MTARKTWVWIVVGVITFCIVVLVVIAGAGAYFVTRHIKSERGTPADAAQAFEATRARFSDARPLYELDDDDLPRATRTLADLPTSASKPTALAILAWNPDDERLIRLSLPFWILKIGRRKLDFYRGDGFNLEQLQLDVHELERIGPALILDFRNRDDVRVLVWTQ